MLNQNGNLNTLATHLHITPPLDCSTLNFVEQLVQSSRQLVEAQQALPPYPIMERHPYIPENEEVNTDIVMMGTFPPITYFADLVKTLKLKSPTIPTYHGNKGFLWSYLIGEAIFDMKDRENAKQYVHDWLDDNGLHYSDIILFCQRKTAAYSSRDTDLCNIILNDHLIHSAFLNQKIQTLYFTNAAFFSNAGIKFASDRKVNVSRRDAFSLYLRGVQENGYNVELNTPGTDSWFNLDNHQKEITNGMKGMITLNAKLETGGQSKTLKFVSCVSPAAARRGTVKSNSCVKRFATATGTTIETAGVKLLSTVLNAIKERRTDELVSFNS